jgi:mannose-6-phosphate isomerase-like protein (cupin superfamily)
MGKQHAMVPTGTVVDIGDHSVEILATPGETGDRYRLRIVARPGGGPGLDGAGPHVHPVLIETFVCQSGRMRARLGARLMDVEPGQRIEVPVGTVHGFVNAGDAPLVVESEVVFPPPGYRPEADLMTFAAIYDRLRQQPNVDARTGEPPMLQMAVLTDAYRAAVIPPGLAGMLIGPLAAVGRARGYRATMPPDGARPRRA